MIISIQGATNRGWLKYVIYGTDKKPRDTSKVKILKGDLLQGDRIENLTKYKENSYLILLSFKNRVDEKIVRAVLDEFEENFMMGFDKDEYHIDAVWHRDTDDDHVHIRIPKINLRTQTQLQLYFDKKDRSRINAIRDYLDVKYQLESPLDNKIFFKEDNKTYKSNFNIEKFITKNILELHQSELLDSFDDMKAFIEEQGVKIIKIGYDKPNDFHYLTIENETKKMRIKGDIYDEKFWRDSREIREKQINNNQRDRPMGGDDKRELSELKEQLDTYNVTRKQEIYRQYKPSRARATKRFNKREQESISKYKNTRETRTSLFSLKPHTLSHINNYYTFHPFPIGKEGLDCTQRVPSPTKRKSLRSDTQRKFINKQGWKISLLVPKKVKTSVLKTDRFICYPLDLI